MAYTLATTNIDPIRYQLLFERFLNPERVHARYRRGLRFERRQEVIDYVVRKYGERPGGADRNLWYTAGARGARWDVGRAMDLPFAFVDSIAKMDSERTEYYTDKLLKMNHGAERSSMMKTRR